MKNSLSIAGCALLSTVLAACGGEETERGGGSGPDAAATPAEIADACAGDCGFERRCRGETAATCEDDCLQGQLGSIARNMRSDAVRAWSACLAGLACSGRDDDCEPVMMEATGVDVSTIDQLPDVAACLEKASTCPGMDESFDQFCRLQVVLVTPVRNAISSCLDSPCEDIYGCMNQASYGAR